MRLNYFCPKCRTYATQARHLPDTSTGYCINGHEWDMLDPVASMAERLAALGRERDDLMRQAGQWADRCLSLPRCDLDLERQNAALEQENAALRTLLAMRADADEARATCEAIVAALTPPPAGAHPAAGYCFMLCERPPVDPCSRCPFPGAPCPTPRADGGE